MFLKSLEILGFKSFADRTVIEFGNGITVVLGPNGCGKSNIVDAIKWVLGEQSVRNMRAERMDDVIFSGTENRKALNVAEVTLVIANESGALNIERPEISIRRRLFREGDSEYYLNGMAVRLKEIRELFFDTGVGKSAYSVMEQGRIDQVLSNRPEERRYLFEEAAGITKYKIRNSEAERKLARTKENMGQVENILHEVRRSYESLKKQTKQTLEYRQLKEQIFQFDRDIRLIQWKNIQEQHASKSYRLKVKNIEHEKIVRKISNIKAALDGELNTVNAMEGKLIENQKQLYRMDLEKANLEEQIVQTRQRCDENEATMKALGTREQNALEALNRLNALELTRRNDLIEFQDQLKAIENTISTSKDTIHSTKERIQSILGEQTTITGKLADEETRREELQDDLRVLTDDIVRQLDTHLTDSGYDRGAHQSLGEDIILQLGELRLRAEGCIKRFSDQKNLTDADNLMDLLAHAVTDFVAIQTSLDEMIGLFDQYRQSGGDFLGDFLAPEGIITRKRELDERISHSADRVKELKTHLKALSQEQVKLTDAIQKLQVNLEGFRVDQARIVTQVAAAEDALGSLKREVLAEKSRLAEIREQIVGEQKRIKTLHHQIENIMTKQDELDKNQKVLTEFMAGLESGISLENEKMADRETTLKALTEKRLSLEIDREKIRLEMGNLDNEERRHLDEFRDKYSRELRDFADTTDRIERLPKEIRRDLASAKIALKELGRVNFMAPEEFTEVSERYKFLNEQLEDLRKANANLSHVTEEIRRESAVLFLKTYKEIREHFHEMFRRLFGGGRAEIRLVDHEDPLNSGLEIYAQPPGKRLENISLLSGGEKSLCGVALMFATFLVKPSPFCILDEIDAALDEANIQRFVNILAEFGNKSQFLVVTHNKKTVTGSQNLLGVTMQESGVSRLLSLRLDGEGQLTGNENEESVSTH